MEKRRRLPIKKNTPTVINKILIIIFIVSSIFVIAYKISDKNSTITTGSQAKTSIGPKDLPHFIIGGDITKPGEWPFMVVLVSYNWYNYYLNRFSSKGYVYDYGICGGTLISKEWVLTAAHCVNNKEINYNKKKLKIAVGFYNLKEEKANNNNLLLVDVVEIIPHKNARPIIIDNYDIALIKLSNEFTSNNIINNTISLPKIKYFIDQPVMALGWGYTSENIRSPLLKSIQLSITENTDDGMIIARYTKSNNINENMYGIYKGDSGGPLLIWDGMNNRWVQIGVAVGSDDLVSDDNKYLRPTYSIDIITHMQWIKDITGIEPNTGTFMGKEPNERANR